MCGRYALGVPADEIQQLHGYNVHIGEWVDRANFVPRHNVAPRSQAPVIRRQDQDSNSSGSTAGPSTSHPDDVQSSSSAPTSPSADKAEHAPSELSPSSRSASQLILHTMKWGLVPHFSKHEDTSLNTINARSEALVEGSTGMWASIKGRKRCAVVCEGCVSYYEWLKKGKERLPHFTKHQDGRLMLLAGLWDRVVLEGRTEPLWTFTIVTTDACKEFSWLHDRQPVILPDTAALDAWLDTSAGKWTTALTKLCEPYHSATTHPLVCYQVPKEVGKIGTESAAFVQPVQDRKDGIEALFAKQQKLSQKSQPAAHKRSASPVAEHAAKKQRVEKVNAWEDDSDIECIDDPRADDTKQETTTPSSSQRGKTRSANEPLPKVTSPSKLGTNKVSKPSPRKSKASASQGADSSAKITSFFAKK
ncbi:hypothetical protein C2E23DRAFT_518385 [Lenzites betulinus]|nr:hypothetical protein C2E23DRAFT_518385 [Lenzites betulinus]